MRFDVKNLVLGIATACAIAACGGGGGSNVAPAIVGTLSGTAAVGAPIVGATVKVICASGSALTSQPSSSVGLWQVTLTGQTFPCAAQVNGGTINGVANTSQFHSIAMGVGTLNI